MGTFKGTKGEWSVSNEPFTTLVTAKLDSGKIISVCSITKCAETEADAKLISAAPAMLEALENIVLGLNDGEYTADQCYRFALEAIKKATE